MPALPTSADKGSAPSVRAPSIMTCTLCHGEIDGSLCSRDCPNDVLAPEDRPLGSVAIYHYELKHVIPWMPQSATGESSTPEHSREEHQQQKESENVR